MKGRELIRILEEQSPPSYACKWDNTGFLAGDAGKEITKAYLVVDVTDEAIEEAIAEGADLIISHHPLIFGGIKRVTTDDFIGRRLIKLIKNDIACYAMHTNFDVKGMADLSAAMLGLEDVRVLDVTETEDGKEEGIGRVGRFMAPMALAHCAKFVKAAFSLKEVKIFGDAERVLEWAAICPGAGKSEMENALRKGADVFITGDIGHHEGMDALAQGMCVIDAGHYGLEHVFIQYMKEYLEQRCSGIQVAAQEIRFPYWMA